MIYTPTTTDVEKMNRTDLVFELSKKCHIDHYQHVLTFKTETMRALLKFYNEKDEKDFVSFVHGFTFMVTYKLPVYKKGDKYKHEFVIKK